MEVEEGYEEEDPIGTLGKYDIYCQYEPLNKNFYLGKDKDQDK